MRVSDVISNVTKQNKTWTSWSQGTKLRVRLSLANARFASLLSKVMYIIKRKFKCLSWIWLLFPLVKWKNVYFIRAFGTHEIYIFSPLDEIKVIFTPNIWISSIYVLELANVYCSYQVQHKPLIDTCCCCFFSNSNRVQHDTIGDVGGFVYY